MGGNKGPPKKPSRRELIRGVLLKIDWKTYAFPYRKKWDESWAEKNYANLKLWKTNQPTNPNLEEAIEADAKLFKEVEDFEISHNGLTLVLVDLVVLILAELPNLSTGTEYPPNVPNPVIKYTLEEDTILTIFQLFYNGVNDRQKTTERWKKVREPIIKRRNERLQREEVEQNYMKRKAEEEAAEEIENLVLYKYLKKARSEWQNMKKQSKRPKWFKKGRTALPYETGMARLGAYNKEAASQRFAFNLFGYFYDSYGRRKPDGSAFQTTLEFVRIKRLYDWLVWYRTFLLEQKKEVDEKPIRKVKFAKEIYGIQEQGDYDQDQEFNPGWFKDNIRYTLGGALEDLINILKKLEQKSRFRAAFKKPSLVKKLKF